MKYNNHDIHTVWVDLDDTIIDFKANARTSLHIMWQTEPLLQAHFATPDLWATTYERHNHALWDLYNVAAITRQYLKEQRFTRPLVEAGVDEKTAHLTSLRFDTLYLDLLARQKKLIPGALDLLRHLRTDSTVKIGILSNGFKEVQHRKIKSAGLEPYIDIVVLSDDIGINKPDTRLYTHAMQRTGCTDPASHIMIGDNPHTDIAGAIAAGWHAILVGPQPLDTPMPCLAIPSPDQAITLLQPSLHNPNKVLK